MKQEAFWVSLKSYGIGYLIHEQSKRFKRRFGGTCGVNGQCGHWEKLPVKQNRSDIVQENKKTIGVALGTTEVKRIAGYFNEGAWV